MSTIFVDDDSQRCTCVWDQDEYEVTFPDPDCKRHRIEADPDYDPTPAAGLGSQRHSGRRVRGAVMSPADRAKSLHALSEAAREEGDLRTADALKAAAGAWERIAGPGVSWSYKQLQGDLLRLRLDVVAYRGPFQPPKPPKAPAPSQEAPDRARLTAQIIKSVEHLQEATIEF